MLRRVLTKDGRSRAFINDQPVGVALLRRAGALLVEVQGQHEQIGLADPASHAGLLDAFGVPRPLRDADRRGLARLARGDRGAGGGARGDRRGASATRNGCVTRWTNWPAWRRRRARRSGWRRSASACSRASAAPRRSPRRSPN